MTKQLLIENFLLTTIFIDGDSLMSFSISSFGNNISELVLDEEVSESSNRNEYKEEVDSTAAVTHEALVKLQNQLNGTGSLDTKDLERSEQIMKKLMIASDDSSDSSSCESFCNNNECTANSSDSDEESLHFNQSGKRTRRITDDENEMNSISVTYEDSNSDLVDSERDEEVIYSAKPRKRLRRINDKDAGDCHNSIEDDIDIKSGASTLINLRHSPVEKAELALYYGYNYRCTARVNHQSDDDFYSSFERDALHSNILELRSYLEENTDATDKKIVHTVDWLREMNARFCEK